MSRRKLDAPDGARHHRGRGSVLATAERASVIGASLAGVSAREIARVAGRDPKTIAAIVNGEEMKAARALARTLLTSRATTYVDLHLAAARNAAHKGDSRLAEFVIDRLQIVEPKTADSGPRVSVQLGVCLPGLGLIEPVGALPPVVVDSTEEDR